MCRQPLLDHRALEHVEQARYEMAKQQEEAVRERAEPLAKQMAHKEREAAEQRIAGLNQLLASRSGEIDKLNSAHSQALAKQKKEMSRQTLKLLGDRRRFDGFLEIGSTGRYLSDLRRHLDLRGDIVTIHDAPPTFSPVDIVERGGLRKLGRFVANDNYAPIARESIADASIELATVFIGLHHVPLDQLQAYLQSLARIVKPGGLLIVRDHDVNDDAMRALVALAHAVFNAGLGVSWDENNRELRHFRMSAV